MRTIFSLGLALGLLLAPAMGWSIEIEELATKRRINGFLINENPKELEIRVPTSGDKSMKSKYELAKYKIVHRLDLDRLKKLSPKKADDYHAYALELAVKTADPEAQETTRRLFLIAAYLEPKRLGPTCLNSLGEMAVTAAEKRKYLAMAFLLDPKMELSALEREGIKPVVIDKAYPQAFDHFLKALRCFRNGEPKPAQTYARHPGVDQIFNQVPTKLDLQTFLKACAESESTAENWSFSEDKLRLVIRAELWAISAGGVGKQQEVGDSKWSAILRGRDLNPVPPLNLELIGEFDPRENLYRKGNWVAP